MQRSDNKSSAIILTFLFPFAGLVYSLANWREKWAKNAFWLACIYMGAVFIFFPEGAAELGRGADGKYYASRLMDMYNSSITLRDIFSSYLVDEHIMDLYQPLLTYFISRFTDNGHVLFTVYAFVFGFFYSRNIWYILDRLPNKRLKGLVILVALYFLICPISQINGVRMWTALHVFVYGMMPYLVERDRSKLWWVLITPLIHFSFLYVAIFAVLYFVLPYRIKIHNQSLLFIALAFFVITMFVNSLSLDVVGNTLAEYSPESYEDRIVGYTNQDYADRLAEGSKGNWYVALSGILTTWSYALLLILAYPYVIRNYKNKEWLVHLYLFALLMGGIANVMTFIPSGGRFRLLSHMFIVPVFLIIAMSVDNNASYRKYVNIASLFLLLPLVFQIRVLFDYYGVTLVLGNFITALFIESNIPIIDFIKAFV